MPEQSEYRPEYTGHYAGHERRAAFLNGQGTEGAVRARFHGPLKLQIGSHIVVVSSNGGENPYPNGRKVGGNRQGPT